MHIMEQNDTLPLAGHSIFAAIDIETSGLDVERCEILDLAIVPLTSDFHISELPEFTARIRAEHRENAEEQALRINGLNPSDGDDRSKVFNNLVQWLRDNGIGRIVPVAHNLEFDLRFLRKTFPELSRLFDHHGRDSMRLAIAVNDIVRRESGEDRFQSVSLRALKEALNISGEVSHNAFEDAKDSATVYRKLTEMLTQQ